MYAWQFAKAQSVASTRFVSMQNHYNLVYREEEREMIPQCAARVASEHSVPGAQVALPWLLHKPGVTAPIVGATKLEHLEDALAAEELSLSESDIARLEERYVPHAIAGHA